MTQFFDEFFAGYGLSCRLARSGIVATTGELLAHARVYMQTATRTFTVVQLDLIIRTAAGKVIIESCGGLGPSPTAAIADAVKQMTDGSFHVLFSALTGQQCSHNEIETWTINGADRTVYIGPLLARGDQAEQLPPASRWFPRIKDQIEQLPLDAEMHWLRVYHLESSLGPSVDEGLIDNLPSDPLEAVLKAEAWPPSKVFYSVRVFMIIAPQASFTSADA